MADRCIDWALLVRAGAEPLSLARERLLSGRVELDEDAERFLASLVEDMEPEDLLRWLSRRGPTPREVPGDVPSNARIVEQLAEQAIANPGPVYWFAISEGEGATLWGVASATIEPEAWDDLAERMLPTQRDARLRMRAVATLHGCDLFRSLCELGVSARIPLEVRLREPDPSARRRVWAICEELLPHRRDPKELARRLHQRAREAVVAGDLVPLWLLDALGLLGPETDPATVLPTRVKFPGEREEVAAPHALYPVALALRWLGAAVAVPWVREQVLAALRRGADPYHMGTTLLGGLAARRGQHAWEDKELTPMLAPLFSDRSAFDDLMRASIDAGVPLSLAWVTVVRDLIDRHDDAWPRALRWLDASLPEVLFDDRGPRLLRSAAYDTAAWPALAELAVDPGVTKRFRIEMFKRRDEGELAVDGPLRARQWILLHAPLPSVVDEALAGRLDRLLGDLEELMNLPADRGARLPAAADARRLRETLWCRYAELPSAPPRRTRLVEMLHEDESLLACGAERVLDHLGALDERDLPRADLGLLRAPTENAGIWRSRYLRLGGLPAARRALAAIGLERLDLAPANIAAAADAAAALERAEHATLLLDVLEHQGSQRRDLVVVAHAHIVAHGQSPVMQSPVIDWIGARLTTNTAWSEDGLRLIESLIDRHGRCVAAVCDAAYRAGGERASLLDAMLMACAEVFGARARGAMQRGDRRGARRALRALMELDAPSRAYRFVGPLGKLAKGDEELEVLVEACQHLLRRDAGRAPTCACVDLAIDRFSSGEG